MWTSTKCTVCRRKQRAPQLAWAAGRAYHSGRLAGLGKAHREDLKQRAQE